MGNVVENDLYKTRLIGKTIRDIDNNLTALVIPKEFARKLDIENSKVMISLLGNNGGTKCLIISKLYKEIIIN